MGSNTLKLGLSTGLLSGRSTLADALETVKEAERLGFD